MSNELLCLKGIGKDFGGRTALDDIHLSLEKGAVTGLVGPNGSGKTTLLHVVNGTLIPDRGSRTWAEPYPKVGFQTDTTVVPVHVTGRTWVNWHQDLEGMGSPDWVNEVVHRLRFAVDLDRPVKTYSKGMRRKLGILLAWVGDPGILLLDEPFEGLDPLDREMLVGLLRDWVSLGRHALVSSHTLGELDSASDRLLYLQAGRIRHVLGEGENPQEVYRRLYA